MDKEEAEALARTLEEQTKDWINDEAYDAYLRREVFGGFKQQIQVVPAEFPDIDFIVLANWELRNEEFASMQEWEEFKNGIENGLRTVALDSGDDQEEEAQS